MAVRENRSPNVVMEVMNNQYTVAETADGETIDTQLYAEGITFVPDCLSIDNGETYTFALYESDTSPMTTEEETEIASNTLAGSLSDLTKTEADTLGTSLNSVGVTTTKRYIRIKGTSSGGSGHVLCYIVGTTQYQPVTNDSTFFNLS
jgi:hypothetical protein